MNYRIYKYSFYLLLINILFHFLPFERKALAPDDYSLLVYNRISENYFFDFVERPLQFYWLDFQYFLMGDNANIGFIGLLISSSLLIISVFIMIYQFILNVKLSFIISLIYSAFYSKLDIFHTPINIHIILVSTLFILSIVFFNFFVSNKKYKFLILSIFFYLIGVFWYEIGVFLPFLLLIFYIKNNYVKNYLYLFFVIFFIYAVYRLLGAFYYDTYSSEHKIVLHKNLLSSFIELLKIYIGRFAVRSIIYGIYQFFNIELFWFILIIFFDFIFIYLLLKFLKNINFTNFNNNNRITLILKFLLIFIIFSIPTLLSGSAGERHTIISSIGVVMIFYILISLFKLYTKKILIFFIICFMVVSQGNAWSQVVASRINSSIFDHIKINKEDIKRSKFLLFDTLSFTNNIKYQLIDNKENLLNTYYGAQVFEDWGLESMVHLIISKENLKVFILKKNHQIINNHIKFNEKLNIADNNIYENNLLPIEDVYIVNFDKVYNNGYKNGNR